MKKYIIKALLCSAVLVFSACGGGGGSSTATDTSGTTPDTSTSTEVYGVVVDPYITGAVLCIDANANDTCDEGETESSVSDENGEFIFDTEPEAGDIIIMKLAGEHNGVPYAYSGLRAVYNGTDIVVSPLTTLASSTLSAEQVAEMLQFAGHTGITAENLMENPMDGLFSGDTVNSENLAVLRSSLAAYMFLRIIEGSETLSSLSPAEIYASGMDTSGAVYNILSNMNTVLTEVLSSDTFAVIQSYDDTLVGLGLPPVSFDDVVASAVAIADKVSSIGYETCNSTSGTYVEKVTAALSAVETFTTVTTSFDELISKLGPAFYLSRIKSGMSSAVIAGTGSANAEYGTYLSCSSGTFIIGDTGGVECYSE